MYHRNHNIHPHIDNERSINNVMLKQQQQQQSPKEEDEGSSSASSRYGSILFVDDGNSSVVGEELDTKIINTAHQQQQQQQPANVQRNWGIVTAGLMVCLIVIAMIIRGSCTMIDNTNNNGASVADGSLITTNTSTTNFPGPGSITPGQLFFSWKSWGYGVVRDYWDQKKRMIGQK